MTSADLSSSGPAGLRFEIADHASLTRDGLVIDFTDLARVRTLTTIHESVSLVSFAAQVHIRPLAAGSVHAAVIAVPRDDAVDLDDADTVRDMGQSLIQHFAFFAPQEPQHFSLTLPAGHLFGHELKSLNIGNPPPRICVSFADLPPASIGVLGRVTYRLVLSTRGYDPAFRLLSEV